MDNKQIADIVLDRLGFMPNQILKKAHGNTREISALQLVLTILDSGDGNSSAKILGISRQTFNRCISNTITPILGKLNGGEDTFIFRFYKLAEIRKCRECNRVKRHVEYHKDSSDSMGISRTCKSCRVSIAKEYYKSDNGKLRHKESYGRNKGVIANRNAEAKINRDLRIPKWSETDLIAKFYAECPEGFHVDHIIPLRGKIVSGLHVISNLQYLTIKDNLEKGNKFVVE